MLHYFFEVKANKLKQFSFFNDQTGKELPTKPIKEEKLHYLPKQTNH